MYQESKRICAIGNFNPEDVRFWVIQKGLRGEGYELICCNTDRRGILKKYIDLWKKSKICLSNTDILYVPFSGHALVPLAWILAKRRHIPLIFDAFISLYDTYVQDRKTVSRFHPKAWIFWLVDWFSCLLADIVLLDTEDHAEFFHRAFGVPLSKILVLPIGSRTDFFRPLPPSPQRDHTFSVAFHGTFIPLQGIETILGAAKILQERGEDVRCMLMGKGQTYAAMRDLADQWQLRNVQFTGFLHPSEVAQHIANADACLGIFGTTDKAMRVIPTKAYDVFSCGKALITAETPAAIRILRNHENVLFCKAGNAVDLAEKILELKHNPALLKRLEECGKRLMEERFTPCAIVSPLVQWISTNHA
jgi:glycosyltransferase involved in cell wall biosynthesis